MRIDRSLGKNSAN